MADLDRRSFLARTSAAAAATAVVGGPLAGFLAGPAAARRRSASAAPPVLVDTLDLRDGVRRLSLPEGFQYRSFQPSSRANPLVLDDGSRLPGRHDGMSAFDSHRHGGHGGHGGHGRHGHDDDRRHGGHDVVTLIRNHEENGSALNGAFGAPGTPVYDTSALGGTSTVRVTGDGVPLHSVASLSGTQMNCSGGHMPWGAWMTCEETVNGYDVGDDFNRGAADPLSQAVNSRLQKTHGFIFEVPVHGEASAEPITHAGRFAHESVAFDPHGGALYLSEDNFSFPSGFYKYVPPVHPERAGRLEDGGRLFMLKVAGVTNADLARHQQPGATFDVEWVEIDEPTFDLGRPAAGAPAPISNDDAIVIVGDQGRAKGAAMFSRLEGTVFDHGWVYFTSTQGGLTDAPSQPDTVIGFGTGFGQIWAYDTRREQLHLLFESPGREVLDFPDNVTTSRRGTLVVCEDHDQNNFLRGLTRHGTLFDIAQNRIEGRLNDEFAGSTFSPDGRTLFVNIQASEGLSIAIWGPWSRIDV